MAIHLPEKDVILTIVHGDDVMGPTEAGIQAEAGHAAGPSAEAESSRQLSKPKELCLINQKTVVKSSLELEEAKYQSNLVLSDPNPPGSRGLVRRRQTKSGFSNIGIVGNDEVNPLSQVDMTDLHTKGKIKLWNKLEWVSLVLIPVVLVCNFVIPYLRPKKLWGLKLLEWEILVAVVMCGRLVTGWIIKIIIVCFITRRKFPSWKRVMYIINKISKAVQNCLWLGFVLMAWYHMLDKKVRREATIETIVHVISKILVCLVVGKVFWLVKTDVVKVLAFSFYVSAYFDRIGESLFDQYVIQKLSGPPLSQKNENQKEEERIVNLIEAIEAFLELDSQDVTAQIKVKNMILGGQITYSNHDESATKIEKEDDAEVAATKIFQNIVAHGSLSFNQKDVMPFMRETEALKTMSLFEKLSGNKDISRKCFTIWVINAFRERKALASALNNTISLVDQLHWMVMILVVILTLIVWFLILGIATGKSLFLVFPPAGLLTVIICKHLYDAIIFLFMMHPFDKGDWCVMEEQLMRVEQINLLTTVFQTEKNQPFKTMNNSFLATLAIENYSRNPHLVDEVEFFIPIATPEYKIKIIKQSVTGYIEKKQEHWYPLTDKFIYMKMEDVNKVLIAIRLTHKMKHPDMNERLSRRGLFIEEMTKIFRKLGIH